MTLQHDQGLADSLDRLGALAPAKVDVHGLLDEVVGAVEALFNLDGAGVMLADPEQALRTVMVTDERGASLERAQESAGGGPCVDAYVYGRPTPCRDVHSDPRYTAVSERMSRSGVHAVLGVPIRLAGNPVGVLNLYVDTPHDWTEAQIAGLSAYAELLGRMLGVALAARRSDELAGQLQRALDSRVVVERAIGYVMASHTLDANRAFQLIRAAARRSRTRVVDLAAIVLDTGRLP
ncbi:MAG TPA: GAF and ANTAR domain-containing protein [Acidimicrobiales bacterium]|nr:GAF and ANTAR domain-containing protein [Acidimicrobiales bacterium]